MSRTRGTATRCPPGAICWSACSGVAWQALGVMIAAYALALAYAKEHRQFGRPIARFQLVQDLLVKSLGNITASARGTRGRAAVPVPRPVPRQHRARLSAGRTWCCRSAVPVRRHCHGP
ncbi:acyl-CoA dehydrogenase family protein [Streptomyces decoyicus]